MAGSVLEDRTSAYRQVAVIPFKAHGQLHPCRKFPRFLVLSSCVVRHSSFGLEGCVAVDDGLRVTWTLCRTRV